MPIVDTKLGERVTVKEPVNIYGAELMDDVFVGPFVEIQKDTRIGAKTRVSSHSFICEKVTIGENCFIGHGVMFTNDKYTEKKGCEILQETNIGNGVRIGSNATILPVCLGDDCIIGAGAVVTRDVPPKTTVVGNPARKIRYLESQ